MGIGIVTVNGVVRGKIVELERTSGLADGLEVTVTLQPATTGGRLPPGEGLRRSAGAWADDAAELEEFVEWNRQQRKVSRREPAP